jgi:hypothetical protein
MAADLVPALKCSETWSATFCVFLLKGMALGFYINLSSYEPSRTLLTGLTGLKYMNITK